MGYQIRRRGQKSKRMGETVAQPKAAKSPVPQAGMSTVPAPGQKRVSSGAKNNSAPAESQHFYEEFEQQKYEHFRRVANQRKREAEREVAWYGKIETEGKA